MKVGIKLDGGPELEKALRDLSHALQGRIFIEAAMAAGEIVRQEASERSPRRTGALAKSIVVEVDKKRVPSVRVGPGKGGWYGKFVELGTEVRYTKKGAHRGQIEAHPFLAPALEAKRAEALRKFRDVVRERLGAK